MSLGIEEHRTFEVITDKKLIINDKVIDYIYRAIKEKEKNIENDYDCGLRYVILTNEWRGKYEEITKESLKKYITKDNIDNERQLAIAVLSSCPEYKGCPFDVTHADPYDYRWEGDYDEDAYNDWEVTKIKVSDFFYNYKSGDSKPYYASHPEKFDWEDAKERTIETKNNYRIYYE